jgi:hypothetical protein
LHGDPALKVTEGKLVVRLDQDVLAADAIDDVVPEFPTQRR